MLRSIRTCQRRGPPQLGCSTQGRRVRDIHLEQQAPHYWLGFRLRSGMLGITVTWALMAPMARSSIINKDLEARGKVSARNSHPVLYRSRLAQYELQQSIIQNRSTAILTTI